jgi:glycosyltransferase involved in cell wall biosynthesis
MSMRICSPHCGIAPESNSGGEVYEREVLKHLAYLGVEIEVILAKNKPYESGIENLRVHYLPISKGLRWYISNLIFPHYIAKIYKEKSFDLLRVHSLRFVGPAALWARKHYKLNVPVVGHHHHLDPSPLNRLIEKSVIEGLDKLITVSHFSKKQLVERLRVNPDKIEVVPNGVNSQFTPCPRDHALVEKHHMRDRRVLLYLGGLKRRKNLLLLLDIFHELKRSNVHKDTVLIIAGSGEFLTPLQRQAQAYHLDRDIIFTGYIPEREKCRYYNLADVFVFTSLLEGFGLSLLEAMACGKPVVAFNVAALPEVVKDGITGFLVKPGDQRAFVDRVDMLLQNEKLRQQIGMQAANHAKNHFSWNQTASRILQIYKKML